MEIWPFEAICS